MSLNSIIVELKNVAHFARYVRAIFDTKENLVNESSYQQCKVVSLFINMALLATELLCMSYLEKLNWLCSCDK